MRPLSTILIEADNTNDIGLLAILLKELKQSKSERDPIETQYGVEHITGIAERIGVPGSVSYEQFKHIIR